MIYEEALSSIEDNISIRVLGGKNASKWHRGKQRLRRKLKPTPSMLALLLVCRKINSEASPIAYGKMSMLLEEIVPWTSEDYLLQVCEKLVQVFGYENLHRIPHVRIEDQEALMDLPLCDWILTIRARLADGGDALGILRPSEARLQPAQDLFCNITRMTLLEYRLDESEYRGFEEGASWLSTTVKPGHQQEIFLEVFRSLKEIVLQRAGPTGGQQTSVVSKMGISAANTTT